MIRSLLAAVGALIGVLALYVILPTIVVGVAVAILLGIGALLTRFFAVTVFEASVIATLVAIPLVWFWVRLLGNLNAPVRWMRKMSQSNRPARGTALF